MPHLQGISREAAILFPPTLDEYIAADNPVRFIDAFVDQLDLQGLGFQRGAAPASAGTSPAPPSAPALSNSSSR